MFIAANTIDASNIQSDSTICESKDGICMFSKLDLQNLLRKVQDSDIEKRVNGRSIYPPLIEDLWSLYDNVVSRKVVSIMEYGSGWSTLVLALALEHNMKSFGDFVESNIRHPNPFCLLTVDSSRAFSNISVRRAQEFTKTKIFPVVTKSKLVEIENRFYNVFENIPLFTANFIYVDGPDSSQVKGSIRGFHVRFGDKAR